MDHRVVGPAQHVALVVESAVLGGSAALAGAGMAGTPSKVDE